MVKKNDTKTVYLRALQKTDITYTHRWHNNPDLYETLFGPFRHVSLSAEEAWLEKRMQFDHNNVHLMITLSPGDDPIGLINLLNIDYFSRQAHMNFFIGESIERGKGYGAIAINEMLVVAFQEFGLNRVQSYFLVDNFPSISACKKCGYKEEGLLRKYVYKGGEYHDALVMSVLKEEWPGPRVVRPNDK
jgi:RimJ/RimL family protein N-acetyltransferase